MSEATKEFLWSTILPIVGGVFALLTIIVLVSAFKWSRNEDAIRYNYYLGKWRRRRWED